MCWLRNSQPHHSSFGGQDCVYSYEMFFDAEVIGKNDNGTVVLTDYERFSMQKSLERGTYIYEEEQEMSVEEIGYMTPKYNKFAAASESSTGFLPSHHLISLNESKPHVSLRVSRNLGIS